MDNAFVSFLDRTSINFGAYYDEIYYEELCNKMSDVYKISQDKEKLLNKFPHIRSVTEDDVVMVLVEDEVKAIQEFVKIMYKEMVAMENVVFKAGAKELYYFLNEIEALKMVDG